MTRRELIRHCYTAIRALDHLDPDTAASWASWLYGIARSPTLRGIA